ncbi:MAG: DUF2452 domain-containing protein [Fulvivirga sp.]|uniref:DUF2452 domain-containing protein n=1 Tax=Fulvivirga sp. TaxID=1931237 RepID=UPI0032ED5ACA
MADKVEKKIGSVMVMSDEELEKLRDKITTTPSTLPYAHHAGSALIKPEDKGKIKGQALAAMHEQSQMHLEKIYEQMKLLLKQAEEVHSRIEISEQIYQAEMKFKPLMGHTYHLYEKEDGKQLLSVISPREWGASMPFKKFVATVKLLSDHTWKVEEEGD